MNWNGLRKRIESMRHRFQNLPNLFRLLLPYTFCLGLFLIGTSKAHGKTNGIGPTQAFNQANVLFETGKYPEAAAAYEAIARAGKVSANLYFNLGTAHLKAGELGRAIFYLRQSEQIAPRDTDTRANLQFAREKAASGRPLKTNLWRDLTDWLTLGEWAALATISLSLWFSLQAMYQLLDPAWRELMRPWLMPTGVTLALLLVLSTGASFQQARPEAVVISKEASIHYGPLEESQNAYTLTDGTEVRVLDVQNGWLRVIDGDGREGWVLAKQIALLRESP